MNKINTIYLLPVLAIMLLGFGLLPTNQANAAEFPPDSPLMLAALDDQCTTDADCTAVYDVCDTNTGTCKATPRYCVDSPKDCIGGLAVPGFKCPVGSPGSGYICVQCKADSDCPAGDSCIGNSCKSAEFCTCNLNKDCDPGFNCKVLCRLGQKVCGGACIPSSATCDQDTCSKEGQKWCSAGPPQPVCTDADEDGYFVEGGECGTADCNDNDANVYPGATESCDGVDNDCDAITDEGYANVEAVKHLVPRGKTNEDLNLAAAPENKSGSTREPLAGLIVRAYDKSEGSCLSQYGVSWKQYANVVANCTPDATCVTHVDGTCSLELPPGEYLAIGDDGEELKQLGQSFGAVSCSESKDVKLQKIVSNDDDSKNKGKDFWSYFNPSPFIDITVTIILIVCLYLVWTNQKILDLLDKKGTKTTKGKKK